MVCLNNKIDWEILEQSEKEIKKETKEYCTDCVYKPVCNLYYILFGKYRIEE